jgi:protein-S-isoprenylcysteine O-methyltransferase Ste14
MCDDRKSERCCREQNWTDLNVFITLSPDVRMSQQRSEKTRRTRRLLLVFQFTITVVLSIYTGLCSRRDYRKHEELSSRTDKLVMSTFISHTALMFSTVRYSTNPLPLRRETASTVGNLLVGVGTVMYALGTVQFDSVNQMMGGDTNGLLTDGIFSYSRNPQYTGWGLTLLGIAVRKRAGLALLPTCFYWVVIHFYLRFIEEPHLKRVFGTEYQQYRNNVPRYITLVWWKRR